MLRNINLALIGKPCDIRDCNKKTDRRYYSSSAETLDNVLTNANLKVESLRYYTDEEVYGVRLCDTHKEQFKQTKSLTSFNSNVISENQEVNLEDS